MSPSLAWCFTFQTLCPDCVFDFALDSTFQIMSYCLKPTPNPTVHLSTQVQCGASIASKRRSDSTISPFPVNSALYELDLVAETRQGYETLCTKERYERMCFHAFIYIGGSMNGMSYGISWWESWWKRQGTPTIHVKAGGVTASMSQLEINRYSEVNRLTTGVQQSACQIVTISLIYIERIYSGIHEKNK